MAGWTTELLMISTIVLSTTWESGGQGIPHHLESTGQGIPHHLVVPNDFLTLDPYIGDPLLDAPISISDDANDIFHTPQKHFASGLSHQSLHTSFPIKKKKPAHSSSHHSSDIQLLKPSHSFHTLFSPQPSHAVHSHHSTHYPSKPPHSPHSDKLPHSSHSFNLHHSTHSPHSVHLPPSTNFVHTSASPVHLPPSTNFVHTSASSLHPHLPEFATSHLAYDPYLYTHPVPDKGAYFPEHGYNVVGKLGAVHDAYNTEHHFPPLGYNLDPYFSDFPIFGYFDFTPEYDHHTLKYDHHRRRRGTAEPHSLGSRRSRGEQQPQQPLSLRHQELTKNPLPLLHRVPRNERPKTIPSGGHLGMP